MAPPTQLPEVSSFPNGDSGPPTADMVRGWLEDALRHLARLEVVCSKPHSRICSSSACAPLKLPTTLIDETVAEELIADGELDVLVGVIGTASSLDAALGDPDGALGKLLAHVLWPADANAGALRRSFALIPEFAELRHPLRRMAAIACCCVVEIVRAATNDAIDAFNDECAWPLFCDLIASHLALAVSSKLASSPFDSQPEPTAALDLAAILVSMSTCVWLAAPLPNLARAVPSIWRLVHAEPAALSRLVRFQTGLQELSGLLTAQEVDGVLRDELADDAPDDALLPPLCEILVSMRHKALHPNCAKSLAPLCSLSSAELLLQLLGLQPGGPPAGAGAAGADACKRRRALLSRALLSCVMLGSEGTCACALEAIHALGAQPPSACWLLEESIVSALAPLCLAQQYGAAVSARTRALAYRCVSLTLFTATLCAAGALQVERALRARALLRTVLGCCAQRELLLPASCQLMLLRTIGALGATGAAEAGASLGAEMDGARRAADCALAAALRASARRWATLRVVPGAEGLSPYPLSADVSADASLLRSWSETLAGAADASLAPANGASTAVGAPSNGSGGGSGGSGLSLIHI